MPLIQMAEDYFYPFEIAGQLLFKCLHFYLNSSIFSISNKEKNLLSEPVPWFTDQKPESWPIFETLDGVSADKTDERMEPYMRRLPCQSKMGTYSCPLYR